VAAPELGLVQPAKFIALAEETGLIVPSASGCLRTACARKRAWQDAGLPCIEVAVNISPGSWTRKTCGVGSTVLDESGLEPEFLDLELTESTLMQNPDSAAATLEQLKQMGPEDLHRRLWHRLLLAQPSEAVPDRCCQDRPVVVRESPPVLRCGHRGSRGGNGAQSEAAGLAEGG